MGQSKKPQSTAQHQLQGSDLHIPNSNNGSTGSGVSVELGGTPSIMEDRHASTASTPATSSAAVTSTAAQLKRLDLKDPKPEDSPHRDPGAAAPIIAGNAEGIPSNGNISSKKVMFTAQRICRLSKRIKCADFCQNRLLIGADDGLFSLDTAEANGKLHPLSTRRYAQLDNIDDIETVISRSGKHSFVTVHEMVNISSKKRGKFETETKAKKIKETKGCQFYTCVAFAARFTYVYCWKGASWC